MADRSNFRPRNNKGPKLRAPVSKDQHAAVKARAESMDMTMSKYMRWLVSQDIPGFFDMSQSDDDYRF